MMWDFGGRGYEAALASRNRDQGNEGSSSQPRDTHFYMPSSLTPTTPGNVSPYSGLTPPSYPPMQLYNPGYPIPQQYSQQQYALPQQYVPQQQYSTGLQTVVVVKTRKKKSRHDSKHKPHPSVQIIAPTIPGVGTSAPQGRHRPQVITTPTGNVLYKPPPQLKPPVDPAFRYSTCTGRKKALCIGINYYGQPNALKGCINDARHVRDFLIRHGYRSEDILVMTEESSNSRRIPTRENMIAAMHWLVRDARPNDALFFHYSGHGSQVPDDNGTEIDGYDETIVPLDYKTSGQILDDDLHATLVRPLPAGCRLTSLIDCCHSGTALDLPYTYSPHARLKTSRMTESARRSKASPADVISWSGCMDEQTSADSSTNGVAHGAMSYAFIHSLTDKPTQTYKELLRSVSRILSPRFSQKPQLGSSHPIDTDLQFVF